MAILVIGGCGFIGSHIVTLLESEGSDVVVLDRNANVAQTNLTRVRYVQGELANKGDVERVFEVEKISEVVHLAGSTVPGDSNLDPEFDVLTNVCGTLPLLDLCVRQGVRKLLFLSSGGAVYGIPQTLPVSEDHPTDPVSSYGITKLAVEKYLRLYKHIHGLEYVAIRAANPYGPGQRPNARQGVIGVFAHRILRDEEITVWGDGSVVRDYFHVSDLARLCVLALKSPAVGIFNAGSGTGRSIIEVVTALEQAIGRPARLRFEAARPVDVPRIILDISLAKRTFGWEPGVDFSRGLAETRKWLIDTYATKRADVRGAS
jgi:UDP-glucose 4-epimerase